MLWVILVFLSITDGFFLTQFPLPSLVTSDDDDIVSDTTSLEEAGKEVNSEKSELSSAGEFIYHPLLGNI